MNKIHDSLILSWDFSRDKDTGVLVVGTKRIDQGIEIINAFQGKEAEKIRDMLITKKETK